MMDLSAGNTPDFWDELAKPCEHYERRSRYAEEFLQRSGIRKGESVFDMGCGSGTLCLPLVDDGHRVFCADFSENMLKSVADTVSAEGISMIDMTQLSWEDDWESRELPVCDLAFASRCMFDADPEDAVKKLCSRARRRVCLTLPINAAKFRTPTSKYVVGARDDRVDYLLQVMKAAFNLGYKPELNFMKEIDWAFISWDMESI